MFRVSHIMYKATLVSLIWGMFPLRGFSGENNRELAEGIFGAASMELKATGRTPKVLETLKRASEADATYYPPLLVLGREADNDGDFAAVLDYYKRAAAILTAQKKRSTQADKDWREVTNRLATLEKSIGAVLALKEKYTKILSDQITVLEKDKAYFNALKFAYLWLQFAPEDKAAQAALNRLRKKNDYYQRRAALDHNIERLTAVDELPGWKVLTGIWSAVAGTYRVRPGGNAWLVNRGAIRKNFRVSGDVKLHWGRYSSFVYLFGRRQTDGAGYGFGFRLRTRVQPETGQVLGYIRVAEAFEKKHWTHSKRIYSGAPKSVVLDEGKWCRVSIIFRGNTMSCRINNELLFTYKKVKYSTGGIAIMARGAGKDREAWVRNLRVEDLP